MMMRTAGGPGLISPLPHFERRRRPKAANLVIFSTVVLAHIGLVTVIYHQSFGSGTIEPDPPEPPPVIISLERPPITPPVPSQPDTPAASPRVNRPVVAPNPTVDPLVIAIPDNPAPTSGLVVNFNEASPEAPGTLVTPEPPRSPPVITRPDWVSRPSAAQMSRAFPDRALADGIGGSATLRCQVLIGGNLSGCAVTGETPAGMGFGRAALSLTRHFKLSPRTVDGHAVDGAAVVFTVRFGVVD